MTPTVITVVVAVLVLAVALFVFRAVPGVQAFFRLRGKRLVTCPETKATAAVAVSAKEAAMGAFVNEPTLRLQEWSRWPERENCGQECLQQVEADSQNCLVWNIVAHWYEGKKCVFCQKAIEPLHHIDRVPALLGPDFKTCEWKDVATQDLPKILSTHQPVCWNCHVAETFRRLHPRLITDRAFEPKRM